MDNQTINNKDTFLQAPRAQQFEFSRMHEGHENASHKVFFMGPPGARLPKFEINSSGINTNHQVPNSEGGSQSAALNLNENTPTTRTTINISNGTSTLTVTTHRPAPEDAITINNSSNPGKSSSLIDEKHQHVVRVCTSCRCNFEENESKRHSNLEEWLHGEMCGNCRKMLIDSTVSIQNPDRKTSHKTEEDEEVNSCCFC